MLSIVVLTDLDGTLLDPSTYSFEAATEALKVLRERGIPLVLVSSNPIEEHRKLDVRQYKLQSAETVQFPTMVLAGDQSQLVALKAVSATYPLRGHNRILGKSALCRKVFSDDREYEIPV